MVTDNSYVTWVVACNMVASKIFEKDVPTLEKWCVYSGKEKEIFSEFEAKVKKTAQVDLKFTTMFAFLEYFKKIMKLSLFEDPTSIVVSAIEGKYTKTLINLR